jgi:hypothetical protein
VAVDAVTPFFLFWQLRLPNWVNLQNGRLDLPDGIVVLWSEFFFHI